MLWSFKRVSLALVVLVALRAMVPVGYMLALPADGPALTFCPTQNLALDLSRLDTQATDTHDHHHGAEHSGSQGPAIIDADSGCGVWLNSVVLAAAAERDLARFTRAIAAPPPQDNRAALSTLGVTRPPVRGPPSNIC